MSAHNVARVNEPNPVEPRGDAPAGAAVREGLPIVAGLAAAGVALAAIRPRWAVAPLLCAAGVAAFFRDPVRALPDAADLIYAAADGIVLGVDEVDDAWYLGGKALRISAFLSIFDVHVNRSPVSGTLTEVHYVPGGFMPAMDRARSEENERQYLAIHGDRGPVVMVQIAGLLARRIVRWVEPSSMLRAGQKVGMIKFGSRTDVLVPVNSARPLVRAGQRVRAGVTPIARFCPQVGQPGGGRGV